MVSWGNSACLWDFARPEPPTVVTADLGPGARLRSWSPNGASYFVLFTSAPRRTRRGQSAFALQERRASDGATLRTLTLRSGSRFPLEDYVDFPFACMSPDARALAVFPCRGAPMRVVVFD